MLHYSKCSYYPFGMNMPGRKFSSLASGYRYGFNGKEDDKDAGEGIQDYGMRIYSERLGKFLSVDPLTDSYPFYSPYHFAGNDVIRCVDLDGGEPTSRVEKWEKNVTTWLNGNTNSYDIYDRTTLNAYSVNGVRDPWTGVIWLVSQDNMGRWFYVKNDNGSSHELWLRHENGRWLLTGGRMVEFKTRNKIDAEQGAAIAEGIGIGVFAGFVAAAATPAAIAASVETVVSTVVAKATDLAAKATISYYKYAPTLAATGKVVAEVMDESGGSIATGGVAKIVSAATKNSSSAKLILGKFVTGSASSYEQRAISGNYTYFQLDNWDEVLKSFGGDMEKMWGINKQFIDDQITAGKNIFFSHDPNKATGYFEKEVNHLKDKGYKNFKQISEDLWEAIKE